MAKTMFISGASRGFGKLWAAAFLKEGYNVVATARNIDALTDLASQYQDRLLCVRLDVNDRAACLAAINQAQEHFGSIDVLINNAGYGLMGCVEEVTEGQARGIFDTNFFGLLWLTQAVLPVMRAQGHGHIIQITSVLGLTTWPTMGLYNATKFAVEGLSETLAAEVKGLGIKVTMVEPAAYATEFGTVSPDRAEGLPAYDNLKSAFMAGLTDLPLGRPDATPAAMIQLVESDNPPLRLLLGAIGYTVVKEAYAGRLAEWDAWQDVSVAAQGT